MNLELYAVSYYQGSEEVHVRAQTHGAHRELVDNEFDEAKQREAV